MYQTFTSNRGICYRSVYISFLVNFIKEQISETTDQNYIDVLTGPMQLTRTDGIVDYNTSSLRGYVYMSKHINQPSANITQQTLSGGTRCEKNYLADE